MYKVFDYIENYNYENGWDSFALVYSKLLKPNSVYNLTKELMYKIVEKHIEFEEQKNVLDVGCGTGNDFPFFIEKGSKITACDYSKGMLNKASETYAKEIKEKQISLYLGSLENLKTDTFDANSFDLIFSITGGLSYIDDQQMLNSLKTMKAFLKPEGKIIVAHFNKFSLFESLFYLKQLQPKKAFVRLRNYIQVAIKGQNLNMYLRTPKSLKNLFEKDFILEGIYPLLAFTPPYQTKYSPSLKRFKKHQKTEIKYLENEFLAQFSDQFVTVLSKKEI